MITVGMNYHVIEGKQQDFEEKFRSVIAACLRGQGAYQLDIMERCGR